MSKAMVSCVLDCSASVTTSSTKLAIASTLVQSIVTHMLLNYKSAEFNLISMGKGTEEIIPMSKTNLTMLSVVQSFFNDLASSRATSSEISYTDGLEYGLKTLLNVNSGKSYSRVLLLVTDGTSPIDKFEYLAEQLFPKLTEIDVKISLFPAIIHLPFPSKQLSESCNQLIGEDAMNSNQIFNENMVLFQSMSDASHGKLIMSNDPGELFSVLSNIPGLSTTPRASKIMFQVLNMKTPFPCEYYSSISKTTLPTLKKVTKLTSNVDVDSRNTDQAFVKRDTSYRNPNAPDEEINLPEYKVKGYRYGSQYVPFNITDEKLLQCTSIAGVELLGFLPREKVPRFHYLGMTNVLQGDNRLVSSQIAIASLSEALKRKNQAGLVRFTKKDNTDPFLGVLLPNIDNDGTLLVQQLPFIEDVRQLDFATFNFSGSFLDSTPSATSLQQQCAIADLVKSMTCDESPFQHTVSETNVPTQQGIFPPVNFTLHNVRQVLRHKALSSLAVQHQDSDDTLKHCINSIEIPFQDPLTTTRLIPFMHLSKSKSTANSGYSNFDSVKQLQSYTSKLNDVFDLKAMKQNKDKKRSYWDSDINLTNTENMPGVDQRDDLKSKKMRGQIKITIKDETAASALGSDKADEETTTDCEYTGPTLNSGSVTPSDDMSEIIEALLLHKESLQTQSSLQGIDLSKNDTMISQLIKKIFRDNVTTLQDIIIKLITVGGSNAHYRKAAACIHVYRDGCLAFDESNLYNQFMTEVVKPSYQDSARYRDFWTLLIQESNKLRETSTSDIIEESKSNSKHLGLISNSECSDSSITDIVAKQFFENLSEDIRDGTTAVKGPEASADIEEDDFFADLA